MQVNVDEYPQLRLLCWNRPAGITLAGSDALAIYERNWRHVDQAAIKDAERALIERLAKVYGNGHLLV